MVSSCFVVLMKQLIVFPIIPDAYMLLMASNWIKMKRYSSQLPSLDKTVAALISNRVGGCTIVSIEATESTMSQSGFVFNNRSQINLRTVRSNCCFVLSTTQTLCTSQDTSNYHVCTDINNQISLRSMYKPYPENGQKQNKAHKYNHKAPSSHSQMKEEL